MQDKHLNPEIEEHNASLDPDPIETMTDDELQDTILEDSNMNAFQKTIAKMDDKRWNLAQRIVGAILGILATVALFWNGGGDNETGFSFSLIVAMLLALVAPNVLEKQSLRRAPKLRVTMAIVMGVAIAVYFVIYGLRTGFKFTA